MILNCKKAIFRSIKSAKLLSFSLLICMVGKGYAQNQIIQLPEKSISRQEIFKQIEKQTELSVDYNHSKVAEIIKQKINIAGGNVQEILQKALKGTGLTFRFEAKHIIIYPAEKSTSPTGKNRKVTGTITDNNGEAIIGGTVQVKGTSVGTITDFEGNFTLDVPEGALLAISYIGYKTQEIRINGSRSIKVKLHEDTEVLDEVIVIGYGTTSTKKIVSAVTAIKGEKLQGLPDANLTATLQGRAAGVIVQNQGGEPGSEPKISIRGGGKPVYVIDGIIASEWDFRTLNPNDIESMSILKDAASLAVYGSRAADGIVQIKTKEGRKGKTSIVYSFNAQYSQPSYLPEKIDAYTYASVQNQAGLYDGSGEYSAYSREEMEIIKNQSDPYKYPNTDWYDIALKNAAPEYRHSLSINGNQKNLNYYISLGMFEQGSLYKSDALNYSRYNLRSNVNTTFEEIGLKVGLNVNGSLEKKEYPAFSANSIWDHLNAKSPLDLAYNPDGTLSSITDHPLMEMNKNSGYDKDDGMFVNTQLVADWEVPWVKGLSIGTMLNYRLNASHIKGLHARAPQYNMDGSIVQVAKPTLTEKAYFGSAYNFELSAAYVHTFAEKHTIDAKAVFTAAENEGFNFEAYRKDYLSATVDQLFAGSSIGMTNTGNAEEGGRLGFVGRLKYDYANRYYLEGSFRYDGSDNFAPGHRWGFFPSVAAAWDITEEPFFKNLNLKDINLLKIRASYGTTGTETDVNRFGYLSTYNMVENAICLGGNLISGFNEGALVSPELLSWYTRRSINIGVDGGFFANKLKGSADYFFYVTKGGLTSPADCYITPLGTKLPQIKSDNEHRREGFELSLRWSDKIGSDINYEIGTNMISYRNLWVTNRGEGLSQLKNPYQRNTHQSDYMGLYLLDNGLYQSIEQVLGIPRRPESTETKLGDIAYQDVNGDGKINGEDKVRYGMPTDPHFTYGVDFMFSYKGFTLSGLFYGTGKRHMMFGGNARKAEAQYVKNDFQLDYWREDNRDATFPRVSMAAGVNGENNRIESTFYLRNAAFLRLKNLSLAYDFKHKLLKDVKWLSTCQVNVTGSNLFTISGVSDYWDPETTDTNGGYPTSRIYSLGVTLGF